MEGERHMYTVANDAHAYIIEHGGGRWITDTTRAIMELSRKDGVMQAGAHCPVYAGMTCGNFCRRCRHFEEQPGAFYIVCNAAKMMKE